MAVYNMGIETKIKIRPRYWNFHFRLAASQSQFFSGNIANIIPVSPLKKMIPLMEDYGGGGACVVKTYPSIDPHSDPPQLTYHTCHIPSRRVSTSPDT